MKQRGATISVLGEGGKKFPRRRRRKKGRLGAFPGPSSPRRRLLYRPKKSLFLHFPRLLPFNLPPLAPQKEVCNFTAPCICFFPGRLSSVVWGYGLHLKIFNTCLFDVEWFEAFEMSVQLSTKLTQEIACVASSDFLG